MNNVSLPTPNTFPDLLLILIALSGEFPSALVSSLPYTEYYKRNAITQMKKAGLIYKYSHDGLHGLRLTSKAKELLLTRQPDRYGSILAGDSVLNAPKYAAARRIRLHRMAEVLVTMFNAGFYVFPWEKSDIFRENGGTALSAIRYPAYYTSLEVKGSGDEGRKFTGSRATGILFGYDDIYLIFNTGSSEMKWDSDSEARLRVFITYDLSNCEHAGRYLMKRPDAIMFASDMGQMEVLMRGGKKKGRNQTVLDDFEHFHYLTSDYHGEIILNILCNPSAKKLIDSILLKGLTLIPESSKRIECDAADGNGGLVLFSYTCDMPRIRRFVWGIETLEVKGTVYCFDFQEEMMRRVCGPTVDVKRMKFGAAVRVLRENGYI